MRSTHVVGRRLTVTAAAFALSSGLAVAATTTEPPYPIKIARATGTIIVDGDLSDAA
jgi:hypothetical protein